ncbi:SpaH/EbpB family LPXTG-anchored major pilin [Corynebacterium hindlerae]|uniref:SpaH/EbpB family LPXTG-anchored major pilin n=1 Tax=Corynebacterium hindlerae TaxID=699041 RepID=A0A7G5FDE7_9CORY|nr:SpaH/EbpB family LPXTG-anchored major pilin [Corynebacterium hindlerae]QMV84638.1 SpaH/EbpB family LPXTG-anchored major pilin [Corynebacterium hindlerae]
MSRRLACFFALVFALLGAAPAIAQGNYTLTVVKTDGIGQEYGAPVSGVPFQINQLLDMPPTQQAQLAEMAQQNIAVLTDDSPHPMGPATTVVTNSEGVARFVGLAPGVYLVREQPYRVGNVDYIEATPFLVSVPAIGERATNDVVIRPKNQPLPVYKETDKFCVTENDPARLQVVTGVPAPDRDGVLHQYAIVDPIDPRMKYLGNLEVKIQGQQDLLLVVDTDYSFAFDDTTNSVLVQFTEAGLAKLAAARSDHPETRVITSFDATVHDWVAVGEVVPNTAYLIPDGWGFDLKPQAFRPIWWVTPTETAPVRPTLTFQQALFPLPDKKVDSLSGLDSVAIPSNPVAICKCLPGQVPPPFPGIPGGPALPITPRPAEPGSSVAQPPATTPSQADRQPLLPRLGLALTGANVLWAIVSAALLAIAGWALFLLGKRKRERSDAEERS